ncbi:MAG: 4Fe-4S dicluster domain-containing protein [Desulfobacterales bacterium]|nr:4Fe-4S dicluster domain-containing protein [Desulfobacterales bacterium]
MDQKTLTEWESKCIQEEPPECMAACPIHIDVRTFLHYVKSGQWDDAYKIIRKTMPVPGILGRICDAPCQARCKRSEVGEAIEIGEIERACMQMELPLPRSLPMPKKDKHIAVIGSSISGLTVAWDLSRKGYRVTILEPGHQAGGSLLGMDPKKLPPQILSEEIKKLEQFGVTITINAHIEKKYFPDSVLDSFDAIYLSMESLPGKILLSESKTGEQIQIMPQYQVTNIEGLFAGGHSDKSRYSPVWQAAEGRWAATSIDRYVHQTSPAAGREKEGPYKTRLYTRIDGIVSLPAVPVSNPDTGYSEMEAIAEASRCLQCECKECVKVCPFLKKYNAYPKKYVREIHNNATVVIGAHKSNKLINSCSLCGLCEQVCPENFAMQDLCIQARQDMVSERYMPPSAHEFALQDMEFSQSSKFSLARHAPGQLESRYCFYPGCQLSASSPVHVHEVYNYLRSSLSGGIGLMLDCCSAPAYWGGYSDLMKNKMSELKSKWVELGKPCLILACSSCYFIFKKYMPEIEIITLWEIIEKNNNHLPLKHFQHEALAIHDPCTTRHEGTVQDSVRNILNSYGIQIEELELGRKKTTCCGFGGLMNNVNPDVAREVIKQRADESVLDYITYCTMCRDSLASTGKRAIHLLDLFFPGKESVDPAKRPCPGWSDRRENRARLKSDLLRKLWRENSETMEAHEKLNIIMAPDVQNKIEERRILVTDIQQVIYHAIESGEKFFQPATSCYKASFRPHQTTFWVEYSQKEDNFIIHNAYAHRMAVVTEGGSQ